MRNQFLLNFLGVSRVIEFSPEYRERQWSPNEIIGPFQPEKGRGKRLN